MNPERMKNKERVDTNTVRNLWTIRSKLMTYVT